MQKTGAEISRFEGQVGGNVTRLFPRCHASSRKWTITRPGSGMAKTGLNQPLRGHGNWVRSAVFFRRWSARVVDRK